MKIAIFHNLPSGGQKRALFEQTKILKKRSHILHEYTFSTTDNHWFDLGKIVERSVYFTINKPSELQKTSQAVASQINERGYDLVYVQPCLFDQTPRVLEHFTTPTVYYCPEPRRIFAERWLQQGSLERGEAKKPFFLPPSLFRLRLWQKLEREAQRARRASLILTNSYYSRETLYHHFGVFARVNYLGVDTNVFETLPQIAKENAILHVGTSISKAPEFSIEALARVKMDVRPKLFFRSLPKDSEAKRLKKQAEEKEVEIDFIEEKDDAGLVRTYNRVKLVICPSIMEPFGLVALEAMSCGIPVLAVKEGGYRESIIQGETGFLLERDPAEFTKVIEALLKNEQEILRLGRQARVWVEKNWTWERSVEQLERYFAMVRPP